MNKPISVIEGTAYPFGMKNCDTDVIIGAEWLKTTSRAGLGRGAFARLRASASTVFDDPRFAGSPILVAGDNFGCGSSREHAAWAMIDMGIRVVIAPSFSDIFSGNAFKNGILTVALPQSAIDRLMEVAQSGSIIVDLEEQTVATSCKDCFEFEIDPFRKYCLSMGLDEIGLSLETEDRIAAYEDAMETNTPWLNRSGLT